MDCAIGRHPPPALALILTLTHPLGLLRKDTVMNPMRTYGWSQNDENGHHGRINNVVLLYHCIRIRIIFQET